MFGINWRSLAAKALLSCVMAVVLVFGLVGCGDRIEEPPNVTESQPILTEQGPQISEVSPPAEIQKLRQALDKYQPQVAILSPQPNEVIEDTTLSVKLQVRDLPVFKNEALGLGPHLHLILDNQPYRAIYNPNEPVVFEDLAPGTHTLRVFASRPWHESFKNDGAYAQTTFHLFAKTDDNKPDSDLPLLTYSRPKGSYGAEPIMLDYYLSNAPLHFVAQENPEDEIVDWRIRVRVNGESFVVDRWEPIYLKGFKRGQNWVQIEFLDEQGNPVNNTFNNTVRLITYEPRGKDTLSKLVRGDLKAEDAIAIVDPTYNPPPAPTPEPVAPEPETLFPIPEPEEMPVEVVPEEFMPTPEVVEPTPIAEPEETPAELVPEEPIPTPEAVEPAPLPEAVEAPVIVPAEPTPKTSEKSQFSQFLDRFRRPSSEPAAPAVGAPPLVPAPESLAPEPVIPEAESELKPEQMTAPEPAETESTPEIEPEPEVQRSPEPELVVVPNNSEEWEVAPSAVNSDREVAESIAAEQS